MRNRRGKLTMGYITDFQGEITITPPIPWGQIKDSPWIPGTARDRDEDVMFRLSEMATESPDGLVVHMSAVAIASTWDEEARGYSIVEHLQRAVDAYPDHEFSGYISAEGEECADFWRLAVVDRRAVKIKPVITWPGESDPALTRALMDAAQAQGMLRAAKDALSVPALHARNPHHQGAPVTTNLPAYAPPDYRPADSPGETAALAGWDISRDSRINYGRDHNDELCVTLSASSTGPAGIRTIEKCRTATPAQIVEHARHLLLVARDEITADPRMIMAPAICDVDTAITFCANTTRHIAMANGTPEETK
jgi:hypothetical protein